MKLQDTLSNSEQELDISKKVRIYLCGVTVYDESHIGHARTIIVFDVLRKYLERKGAEIDFIQNFTDVDDKIINRAQSDNTTAEKISTKYIENYFRDFDGLNVKRATNYPKATEHIEDIIKFIEKLVEKQIAYTSKNGVYFSISKFPEYGKLSKKKIDELQSGSRIEIDEEKRDPLDFVVWKFSDVLPVWDSPWGKGRPGWHIECSAMSIKYLGENFEIHGGGRDLIFPHHENEIAQSEAVHDLPYVNYWMHNGFVRVDNKKMSKSLDNFFTVRDVLARYQPEVVRFFILRAHYRSPLNYSDRHLEDARHALDRLYTALKGSEALATETLDWNDPRAQRFMEAMNDDFNTPEAIAVLFDLANETNKTGVLQGAILLKVLGGLLGLLQQDPQQYLQNKVTIGDPTFTAGRIEQMIQHRLAARKAGNYTEADRIRKELLDGDITLEDNPQGTTWRRG